MCLKCLCAAACCLGLSSAAAAQQSASAPTPASPTGTQHVRPAPAVDGPTATEQTVQGGVPSIDTVSWHSGTEGIGRQSNYLHADIDATVDLRDDDFMPRAGTYARVGVSRFSGLGVQDCSFVRTHVDVRHYVPVAGFSGADSIAIRGALSMTASGSGRPSFYFLPRLGGGSTLRGYETSRFVDAQAMLVSAEYRWQVRRKLQIVGFVDAGQVAPAMSAFAMGRFDAAGGAGIRYRGFRVDYAVGREGGRFHVGFGPTF